ncbi:hypothetical protein [Ensifer adhaerens]|uniref:hypothetical protein n=1 Tax=Ensifer adhaerens TaxID=106592 RepID=UPI001C4DEB5F|nr:hypothetical protein [Ensifer adhaerens]MBW0369544.1 hypothetical protein [Ensifer adhaerens]UCM21343.1 hypothetical protein LDL63_07145 [Ensifer adhaerens]
MHNKTTQIVIAATLVLTMTSTGEASDESGAEQEALSHRYLQCAAYFSLSSEAMEKLGYTAERKEYDKKTMEAIQAGEVLVVTQGRPIGEAKAIFEAYLRSTIVLLNSDPQGAQDRFEKECDGPLKL